MAVVLFVQSLYADGGLTALGLNITNMAVVGVFGGWAVFRLLRRALPATRTSAVVASGIATGVRARRPGWPRTPTSWSA